MREVRVYMSEMKNVDKVIIFEPKKKFHPTFLFKLRDHVHTQTTTTLKQRKHLVNHETTLAPV